jgi:hypothetical protein
MIFLLPHLLPMSSADQVQPNNGHQVEQRILIA